MLPIFYAYEGNLAGNADETIAGLEVVIEWFEQRSEEGLIPAAIAEFLIDCANSAISQLGGSNTSKTFCLTSAELSCVTAVLNSIRWELPILSTRLSHDFSYTFAGGDPATIEMSLFVATTGPFCAPPWTPPEAAIWTATVRAEPGQIANPNMGGSTLVPCIPFGIMRGVQWDGFEVRDSQGVLVGSCSKSAGDPCWEAQE